MPFCVDSSDVESKLIGGINRQLASCWNREALNFVKIKFA